MPSFSATAMSMTAVGPRPSPSVTKRCTVCCPSRPQRMVLRPVGAIASPGTGTDNGPEECRPFYDRNGNLTNVRWPSGFESALSLPPITPEAATDDLNRWMEFKGLEKIFREVMCGDYGFRSGTGKMYEDTDGSIPANIYELARDNFNKELAALKGATDVKGASKDSDAMGDLRSKLKQLKLDDKACWELEKRRDRQRGKDFAPPFIKIPFYLLCWMTDNLFDGRPIQRFWFLEEVARMPYMSYISMMHLYESLGWFRAGAPVRKVHFAEEWNEMHHLMIMESLGGDQSWGDRFLAQHAAVFYFWLLCVFYAVSPQLAYKFSCLVEGHAIDTYDQFSRENKALLEQLPPPYCAVAYYMGTDVYMLDEFTVTDPTPRRPSCNNLYDVFRNIHDDEVEHEQTMQSCQVNELPKLLKAKADNSRKE